MDKYVQAWQEIGSISLLTCGLYGRPPAHLRSESVTSHSYYSKENNTTIANVRIMQVEQVHLAPWFFQSTVVSVEKVNLSTEGWEKS